MPKRPGAARRWLTAATWPLGIALTSWDYMWRTTPMHRREASVALASPLPPLLSYPAQVGPAGGQGQKEGPEPLFLRLCSTRIRRSRLDGPDPMEKLQADLNVAAPTKFAR